MDVLQHVEEAPFAWLFSADDAELHATPLPLLADTDDTGRIVSLTGHMARSNPHVGRLRTSPRALVVFLGPNSYISPSWCRDRKQAPSWNYVLSQYIVDVEFSEEGGFTDDALHRLVEFMERGRPHSWSVSELGDRYEQLRQAIIGFRAHVVTTNAKFKLGQNEKPEAFSDYVTALAANGNKPLADWMERYGRLR
jgi:transcriptional regulator